MGSEELETDYESQAEPARARRALSLIFVSIFVVALTAVAYLRPSAGPSTVPATPPAPAAYQLAAVDFVTPTTGWFAATFDAGRFAIMNTTDAGTHWTRQLTGDSGSAGVYVNFFDSTSGVVAVLGPQSVIYRTGDGGHTWSPRPIRSSMAYPTLVSSMSFADAAHGWLLLDTPTVAGGVELLRTSDGGASWTTLGSPVVANDFAYQVHFTNQ